MWSIYDLKLMFLMKKYQNFEFLAILGDLNVFSKLFKYFFWKLLAFLKI